MVQRAFRLSNGLVLGCGTGVCSGSIGGGSAAATPVCSYHMVPIYRPAWFRDRACGTHCGWKYTRATGATSRCGLMRLLERTQMSTEHFSACMHRLQSYSLKRSRAVSCARDGPLLCVFEYPAIVYATYSTYACCLPSRSASVVLGCAARRTMPFATVRRIMHMNIGVTAASGI